MKQQKLLTAIIATTVATSLAVSTQAREKTIQDVPISVSGFFNSGIGVIDGDLGQANQTVTQILGDARLQVGMEVAADNGLTFGGRVQLDGDTDDNRDGKDTNYDEAAIFVRGDFGTLTVGDTYNAADTFLAGRSNTGFQDRDIQEGYVNDFTDVPWDVAAVIRSSSFTGVTLGEEKYETKIRYDSPTISGFSGGISYVPDTSGKLDNDGGYENVISAYGNLSLGDFNVGLFGEFGDFQNGPSGGSISEREDISSIGANLSWANDDFNLYATYVDHGDSGQFSSSAPSLDDVTSLEVGAGYRCDEKWAFGLNFFSSESAGGYDYSSITLGATKDITPNIVAGFNINHTDFDMELMTGSPTGEESDDGIGFSTTLSLRF